MNKLLAFTALGVALAGGALAQTFTGGNQASGLWAVRGMITSLTTVPNAVQINPLLARPVRVALNASGTTTVFVTTEMLDGTLLTSQTIALTSLVPSSTVFLPAVSTHGFETVRVSPSAGLTGLNNVSVTVLQ